MIFTPEVISALQILKDNAENDFELHRISVLEKDLTAPPKPEVIDEKHQKFDGIIYYVDKGGHFHKDVQLHRAVWSYYNGAITIDGYDVHHADVNPANNNIENLCRLTRAEHKKIHSNQLTKTVLKTKCPQCGKYFKSKYSEQKYCSIECYNQARHIFHTQEKTCLMCSKKFFTRSENPNQKYCSRECADKAKILYNRNKICPVCKKHFTAPAFKPHQLYCSRLCSNKAHTKTKIEKICPVCGKIFLTENRRKQKHCCSKSCSQKYHWQKIKASLI